MHIKKNKYDLWKDWCLNFQDQINSTNLPLYIFKSESIFRDFVTNGQAYDSSNNDSLSISNFSDKQLNALWDFINRIYQFDMDAILFDAFNDEFKKMNI